MVVRKHNALRNLVLQEETVLLTQSFTLISNLYVVLSSIWETRLHLGLYLLIHGSRHSSVTINFFSHQFHDLSRVRIYLAVVNDTL
jgi:hypothetical protein